MGGVSPTEAQIRHGIVKQLRELGCAVWDMEQNRATRQTPGFPDLFWVWESRGWMGFWEVKRPGKYRTKHQITFGEAVEAVQGGQKIDYYVPTSVHDAMMRLSSLGIIEVIH